MEKFKSSRRHNYVLKATVEVLSKNRLLQDAITTTDVNDIQSRCLELLLEAGDTAEGASVFLASYDVNKITELRDYYTTKIKETGKFTNKPKSYTLDESRRMSSIRQRTNSDLEFINTCNRFNIDTTKAKEFLARSTAKTK